jgi:hypothetical protein
MATGANLAQQILQWYVCLRCLCIIQIVVILAGQNVYVICPTVA